MSNSPAKPPRGVPGGRASPAEEGSASPAARGAGAPPPPPGSRAEPSPDGSASGAIELSTQQIEVLRTLGTDSTRPEPGARPSTPPTRIDLKVSPAPKVPRELVGEAERADPSIPIELPPDPAMGIGRPSSRPPRYLPAICDFGRYELLGRLALGGMAEIFLARETASAGESRYLVIKRILPHVADESQFVEMFLQEARLAMRLNHPNICHVYETGQQEGAYYMAMEWVNGLGLGRLIRRARDIGGLPLPVVARVISHVAAALHHAHRARDAKGKPLGIVHRDVSPQNVMVSYDGSVKLLDFGIAKAQALTTKTQAGWVKGKFAYMSPQQCQGEEIDARSDVFSLGVCLYEALVGRSLYHRKTQYETMKAIIDEPVPSARAARPDVPPELDAIVQKALAKKPEDRFATAGAMSDALEVFLADGRHVVSETRIAELLERLCEDEIRRGPMVDSTPFGRSFERLPGDHEHVDDDAADSDPPMRANALGTAGLPVLRARRRMIVVAAVALLALGVLIAAVIALSSSSGDTAVAVRPSGARSRAAPPTPTAERDAPVRGAGAGGGVAAATGGGTIPPTSGAPGAGEPPTAAAAEGTTTAPTPADVPAVVGTTQPAARERRPREDAPAQEQGRLDINTRPWSRVYLRSRLLGTTPIGGVRVPAGRHRLTFVDPQGNRHSRSVTVVAGRATRIAFDLRAPP
ncbi:MAG: serine/threonine protein kinase [Deltaproteobacteria bacterium]|nr:serine/threonine protein kinase [Deltaproteobacteria bacterium]